MAERAPWPHLQAPASWKNRSDADRADGILTACATAMQLLEDTGDRAARLERVDPVPASTRVLLRRLATGS